MFKHELLTKLDISEVAVPNEKGRHYSTPEGVFPSVTTVLSRYYDKDKVLQPWKDRVGHVKATKILEDANYRGTIIHHICEKYVLNDPNYRDGVKSIHLMQFRRLKKLIDQHVTTIYGVEQPLYSLKLKTAGKTDLIAAWDGEPAIIDYKTSIKEKKESWIENYLVQATTYGNMANEMYSLDIKKFVIMIAVDHLPPQLIVKNLSDYQGLMETIFINKRSV